jgi:hypothetical protein
MILYILASGCKTPARTFKPRKSHVGTYSSVESVEKGFYAAQDFLGYAVFPNEQYNPKVFQAQDTLPKMKVTFINHTDSTVIVHFPFNWSTYFISEPTCFSFRTIVSPDHRVEFFSPDQLDTLNNFVKESIPVVIPAKEQLEMDVFIYSGELVEIVDGEVREFEGDSTGLWNFSVQFNYFYKFKRKSYPLTSYRTEPVAIDVR